MNASSSKVALLVVTVIGLLVGFFFVQSHPRYFNNVSYLSMLLMLEVVLVSLWHYEKIFFPLLMMFFFWAGMDLPFSSVGMTARWFVLVAAATAGFVMWMRDRRHTYGAFHLVALFCVAAALVSALVSSDPETSVLKVLSLFLLFLYGATGARLAILGREVGFMKGLVLASEILVYFTAAAYLGLGASIFGNPNSLGAVMAVLAIPILLWGVIIADNRNQKYRRTAALILAGGLLYDSLSRASMLAAAAAVIVLCTMLRRQRLLVQGAFLGVLFMASAAVLNPTHFEQFVQATTSNIVYKGKKESDVLGSRRTPWQDTVAVIKQRPWFGTGFGTSYMGQFASGGILDISPSSGGLYTKEGTNREHGNSYLSLAEYVGLFGIIPFALLIFLVLRMIVQVCLWMRHTSNPYHCAVPLAMVLLAGLLHAFFEDWLTAVGYYLCVFFWTSAFWLRDMMPSPVAMRVPRASPAHPHVGPSYGAPVPTR